MTMLKDLCGDTVPHGPMSLRASISTQLPLMFTILTCLDAVLDAILIRASYTHEELNYAELTRSLRGVYAEFTRTGAPKTAHQAHKDSL